MDGGRYASMDGGGRATQDDSMDGIGRVASGTKTDASRDGGGRIASGTKTEQLPGSES